MKNPNLHALNASRLAVRGTVTFRAVHIAWCLLRGRTLDQIESTRSNPHLFPSPSTIARHVAGGYRPHDPLFFGTATPQEYEEQKKAFVQKVTDDLTAWKKRLHLTWLETDAGRRKRNALKRSTPRPHPRPRPENLPARVA